MRYSFMGKYDHDKLSGGGDFIQESYAHYCGYAYIIRFSPRIFPGADHSLICIICLPLEYVFGEGGCMKPLAMVAAVTALPWGTIKQKRGELVTFPLRCRPSSKLSMQVFTLARGLTSYSPARFCEIRSRLSAL